MTIDNQKYEKTVLVTSVTGFVILILSSVVLFTLYTSTGRDSILPDQKSQDRLTTLNEALRSLLGNHWPFVLMGFMVMLGIMLICLYLAGSKQVLTLNISDNGMHIIKLVLIVFSALLIILFIILAIYKYQNINRQRGVGLDTTYIPSAEQQQKNTTALLILGLLLFLIIVGGYMLWHFIIGRKRKENTV